MAVLAGGGIATQCPAMATATLKGGAMGQKA